MLYSNYKRQHARIIAIVYILVKYFLGLKLQTNCHIDCVCALECNFTNLSMIVKRTSLNVLRVFLLSIDRKATTTVAITTSAAMCIRRSLFASNLVNRNR